jgi:D-inositol-3-phosphate glycosyltransferase
MYKGPVPPLGFFRRPRGYIDYPDPKDDPELPRGPVHILGWCLFPGATVARVEISVNGAPEERARLGMERGDIPARTSHPAAPISGFEHKCDLTALPAAVTSVRIEAIAHATDGRTLRMDPVELRVAPLRPVIRDEDARAAAEQRARSRRALRPRPAARPDGPQRLLVFTHVLTHGGASLYLLELLKRLTRDHGFECEVVSMADGPLREPLEQAGIAVHLTDGFPVRTALRYEGHVAELVAWASAGGFDAVLVNTLGAFAGGDAADRLGVPAVWAVHESFPLPMFWHSAYAPGALHPHARVRAEQAFARAAAVVFPAEATRRLFLDDADPDRLLTIPYGIELDAIDAAARREPTDSERDAQTILCLGSIEARKSQTMLAEAFAQIAGRHPRAQLVLVGATDDAYCADYRAALKQYVKRAKLERRIRIVPTTPDPYAWHMQADVVVCASDVESLPRSVVEAMVFGRPVLSTKVFGVPELIEDGRTGYLCETRDVADLAAGLDRVLSAPAQEIDGITQAAARHARARHDPRRYAATMATLLRDATSRPTALPRVARGR